MSIEAEKHAMPPALTSNLIDLREAMGIMQHHDAVTGTEMQHVAEDYAYLLNKGVERCAKNAHEVLNHLTISKKTNTKSPSLNSRAHFEFENCLNMNISSCEVSENASNFMVTVYNPLAQLVQRHIRIPVASTAWEVKDPTGKSVATQLVPIPQEVLALHYRISEAKFELVFLAKDIPPVGYRSFYVSKIGKTDIDQNDGVPPIPTAPITIGNDKLKLQFDENGLLSEIITEDGERKKLVQSFHYYIGAMGNNRIAENRSSGAYTFRPNGTINSIDRADIRVVNGDIVDEVHQV